MSKFIASSFVSRAQFSQARGWSYAGESMIRAHNATSRNTPNDSILRDRLQHMVSICIFTSVSNRFDTCSALWDMLYCFSNSFPLVGYMGPTWCSPAVVFKVWYGLHLAHASIFWLLQISHRRTYKLKFGQITPTSYSRKQSTIFLYLNVTVTRSKLDGVFVHAPALCWALVQYIAVFTNWLQISLSSEHAVVHLSSLQDNK